MRLSWYSWAGIRTSDFDTTLRFFSEIFGHAPDRRDDAHQYASYRLNSGQTFEVLGPKNPYYALHEYPVIGFQVDDLKVAREELSEKGIEWLTDIDAWGSDAWSYFRGPDGYVFQLLQRETADWRGTVAQALALAARLEGEGQYNIAKLMRAAVDSLTRRASFDQDDRSAARDLTQDLDREIASLAAWGVHPSLIAAIEQGVAARKEGRLPLLDETPHPYVCRTCGHPLLSEPDARCPVCGAWPATFQAFLPVYWLNALEPSEALEQLGQNLVVVEKFIEDLPENTLARAPDAGGWSLRNAVSHLRDAQGVLQVRLDRMISHDNPALESQAVFEWADQETDRPPSTHEIFGSYRDSRNQTLTQLQNLPLKDWWRTGRHEEFGTITIRQHVSYFATHEITHFQQIEALRRHWLESG